jgi:hypothetical protein
MESVETDALRARACVQLDDAENGPLDALSSFSALKLRPTTIACGGRVVGAIEANKHRAGILAFALHIQEMIEKHDPSDLKVSARPAGNGKWKWTVALGDSAPVKTGIVAGTRQRALATGHGERERLISRGYKA